MKAAAQIPVSVVESPKLAAYPQITGLSNSIPSTSLFLTWDHVRQQCPQVKV